MNDSNSSETFHLSSLISSETVQAKVSVKDWEDATETVGKLLVSAGKITSDYIAAMKRVLKEMGPDIQWIHSYVTGNKIYCIYKAKNKELIMEHAKKGGFPANSVNEVANVINPETAN